MRRLGEDLQRTDAAYFSTCRCLDSYQIMDIFRVLTKERENCKMQKMRSLANQSEFMALGMVAAKM